MHKLTALFSAMALLGLLGTASCGSASEEVDTSQAAAKPGAHWRGTATCSQSGDTLTCSGSVCGLGNKATDVTLEVTAECINKGQHSPPGLVSATEEDVAPENGCLDFSVSATSDCPSPNMTTEFTSPATISLMQGNTEVFTGTISF